MPVIKTNIVRTDSFSMNYFKFGKGKKTLVIIPGLSVQSIMGLADEVAKAYSVLTDSFTVYLIERRNELPDTYSAREMAHDTAAAIKALGLENVSIFGASQGGMIAMDIALDYPELVQRLVLASVPSYINEERFRVIDSWIKLAEDKKREELYLSFGRNVYPEEVFEQSRELLTAAAKTLTDEELERFVIIAEGMRDHNVHDELSGIACPVMLICSDDDKVFGTDYAFRIRDRLKDHSGFEFYMYNGFGHAVYDTAPDFKERLLKFLVSSE
ncbi:MAG: alpha/beta hydrolase [Ruminococcus sp.]|nr:alpha/beta hydrolase [Ruminococcus sp.]